MAKQLKDILKQAHDTIKGVRPSTTTDLSLGKDPGVDYDPKAKDEQDFVAKHSVQKWDDSNGNGADVFQAANVKHSQTAVDPHGYKKPSDKKVNEESFDEAWIVTHKDGKVTTHAGQKDAMRHARTSPGSKVSATHGAMGQKAYDVLAPHQQRSSNLGTFSAAGYTPPEKKKKVREEAEQVDEVLTKNEPASTWIRDFIKSKDPKFAGKSKKERQRMALGAYYAKQRNEEADIEEGRVLPNLTQKEPEPQHSKDYLARVEKEKAAKKAKKDSKNQAWKAYVKTGAKWAKPVQEDLAVPLLGGMDDESAEMAKAQLKALAAKANALADQMSDDLMVEPWVQSKIAIAKDYVTTVHDYMIYGDHDKDKENEQTGPDTPMTFPGMSVDVNTGRNV